MIRRVLAFADDFGMPLLVRHLPQDIVVGVVVASIRPSQHATLASHAASLGVPLLVQPKRGAPSYPEFIENVRFLSPDLFIVNSYSMRIGGEVLREAQHGGINVHGALLPWYQGANPLQWAIIQDERVSGVTMHLLTEEIDAGAIIAQKKVPIHFLDTWRDVQARIADVTEMLLAENLSKVINQDFAAIPQSPLDVRYYRRRGPEDGKIEWDRRVLDVYNLIRALVEPHPGAYYEFTNGRTWIRTHTPIQEVAKLKYMILKEPPFSVGGLKFWPTNSTPIYKSPSVFTLGSELGTAQLLNIDWDARTATTSLESSLRNHSFALEQELAAFAKNQLGLRVVCDVDMEEQA